MKRHAKTARCAHTRDAAIVTDPDVLKDPQG